MSYIRSYKRLNRLIQNESFEPMISWGIRMGLSGTLPVVWGLATGRVSDAVWITLTAEAVSWVELKGSFVWRFRTLLMGALLSMAFALIGSVTGNGVWLSVICMFAVGFVATLLKNIGDRASGLAICVYLLFIICNAYPVTEPADIRHRMLMVGIGALWPVVVGVGASLLMPEQEPFRRQIALIWRSIAGLAETVSKSDNRAGYTQMLADIYVKEKEVRKAIDSSYEFYGQMSHQVNRQDGPKYQLVLLRKIASLVAVNVIAMGDEMELIAVHRLDKALRVKAASLFSALKEAVSRMSIYVITLRAEDKLLVSSQINRLKKLVTLIREYPLTYDDTQVRAINRILQLTDRTIKLLESALQRLDQMGHDAPVFRSYSMVKTLFVLRPKYLLSNLRVLFNFNTLTFNYALRSAIAATIALFIFKWYKIDHGYWMPFSVMIIIQPYFGATFQKAVDRVVGTLLGGIAGSLLLYLHLPLHLNEVVLFLTFLYMVYYVRKNYAIAAFVITLNLVLLFNLESAYSNMLMVTRAICTIGGALLAVGSGWALLPTWDKKWLPRHLAKAVSANYDYFVATFFSKGTITNWTRYKRIAESRNSNVFDSFNRYMQEPGSERSESYYDLITCNVRITRDLNIIHMEQDEKRGGAQATATLAQQQRVNECLEWFNKIAGALHQLDHHTEVSITTLPEGHVAPLLLNDAQVVSLEKIIIELKAMYQELS